jgi:phosphohistidine swiveling domain-containing protein
MNRMYNISEWRVWQQNASPMLLTLTLNAGMQNLKEYFGMTLWTSVIIFEENQAKWLFRPKELKLLGQKMIDFLMCPPYRVAFLTGYENAEEKLLRKAQEIQFSSELEALRNGKLISLFEEFSHIYYNWYKYGWFCEPVQFQSQDILTSFLENDIRKTEPQLDMADATRALFTIKEDSFSVTILQHLSECAEALNMALEDKHLAQELEDLREDPDFPSKSAEIVLAVSRDSSDKNLKFLAEKIKEHSSMFYWKQNNYFSTRFLTEEEILTEIFGFEGFELSDPVLPISKQLKLTRENKERLLSERAALMNLLPPYQCNLAILASSIGGSLLDRRKKAIMTANAAFDRILGEVARRTEAEIEDCRLLIPQEIRDFLSSPQEYHQRFVERKKLFLVFQGDFSLLDVLLGDVATRAEREELTYGDFAMTEPFIAEGQEAERVLNQLNSRLNFLTGGEAIIFDKLEGVVTYHDPTEPVIEGIVRIVKDPKIEKLVSGEILVTSSTTPDYADAIRRCKAIVTDWGGQTSHAAIVSRELKKPCIIGTNYASQILNSGDRVRLELEQGIIQVLREK